VIGGLVRVDTGARGRALRSTRASGRSAAERPSPARAPQAACGGRAPPKRRGIDPQPPAPCTRALGRCALAGTRVTGARRQPRRPSPPPLSGGLQPARDVVEHLRVDAKNAQRDARGAPEVELLPRRGGWRVAVGAGGRGAGGGVEGDGR